MTKWPDFDFPELVRRLNARGVDYVVIGGMAAIVYGSPRLTQDLDICYATDAVNLQALGEVLVALDARLKGISEDVPFVADAATLRGMSILTLTTNWGEVDLLAAPPGAPPYAALRRRASRANLGDTTVLVAALDDLLAMKRTAGRAKDLADVEELEAIRRLGRRTGPEGP